MAVRANVRKMVLDYVKAQILTITGGTDWNWNVAAKGVRPALKSVEQIGPEEVPFVAVFVGESSLTSNVSGLKSGEVTIDAYLVTVFDNDRFTDPASDTIETLIDDVLNAVEDSPAVGSGITAILLRTFVETDADEQLGRWSYAHIAFTYEVHGVLGL